MSLRRRFLREKELSRTVIRWVSGPTESVVQDLGTRDGIYLNHCARSCIVVVHRAIIISNVPVSVT